MAAGNKNLSRCIIGRLLLEKSSYAAIFEEAGLRT